jgi:hypothetical protein
VHLGGNSSERFEMTQSHSKSNDGSLHSARCGGEPLPASFGVGRRLECAVNSHHTLGRRSPTLTGMNRPKVTQRASAWQSTEIIKPFWVPSLGGRTVVL